MNTSHTATAGTIRCFGAVVILFATVVLFNLPTFGQGRTGTGLKIVEVKFDEFEDLMTDSVLARLDLFAAELSKDQNLRGVIVGFRRKTFSRCFLQRVLWLSELPGKFARDRSCTLARYRWRSESQLDCLPHYAALARVQLGKGSGFACGAQAGERPQPI